MSLTQNDLPQQLPILIPTLQIGFYRRLVDTQSEYLLPGLLEFITTVEIATLDRELLTYAGEERLKSVARFGLRGELVYPVPYLLTKKPNFLGYYRLLLGFSQKEFYNSKYFGRFTNMEEKNVISPKVVSLIPNLCKSLIESSWMLVNGIPNLSQDILNALTLLTFGGQLRGSYNTLLGQNASKIVFDTIKLIVASAIETEDISSINIRNAAGRLVRIEFSPDPDIAIREQLGSGKFNNRIAIEIKGGKDISNIHNRLGEAEKSHQKAKKQGFNQFWTMVNVRGLTKDIAKRESPTTTEIFDISLIADLSSKEHKEFKELLLSELGLKSE